MTVIMRNYRSKKGEIDIVAQDGDYIVFVEVKYRKNDSYGYPEEAVDFKKQNRIRFTARQYLVHERLGVTVPVRFDVVAILGNEIKHIKDAF